MKTYGENISLSSYSDFLLGEIWNDDMSKIDYNDVSLNTKDFILGYEFQFRNATMKDMGVHFDSKEKIDSLKAPDITLRMPNILCFGIEVPHGVSKEVYMMGIKMKTTEIFVDGIRPAHSDVSNAMRNRGL